DAGLQVGVSGPSMVSGAVAVNVSTMTLGSPVVSWMSAGTLTTGFVVSCTVTVNDFDELCPCVSVAVQWTVLVPNPNVELDAGTQPKVATATSSVADAA